MSQRPFIAGQRVRLPPGKGAVRRPGPSVAWRVVTRVAKRTQGVAKRRNLSLETSNAGAFIVPLVGAAPEAPPRRGATDRLGADFVDQMIL